MAIGAVAWHTRQARPAHPPPPAHPIPAPGVRTAAAGTADTSRAARSSVPAARPDAGAVRRARVATVAWLLATALLLALAVVAGAGPVRLVLSLAALGVLVRLNIRLDPTVVARPTRVRRHRPQETP